MIKLKPKKQKYVAQFKPRLIKGTPLNNSVPIEKRTTADLEKLTNKLIRETNREILKLFRKKENKEFIQSTMDASLTSQARVLMNLLSSKFSKLFNDEGMTISKRMVSRSDKHSKSITKESIKALSGGTVIDSSKLSKETREILKASVNQSVDYIRSIQSEYLTKVKGSVYRSISGGRGLQDLVPDLQKISGQTKRRSKLIALDQVRKTQAALNRSRMKQNGVTKFIWNHSFSGKEPRQDHIAMDGKVYSINNPPVIDKNTGQRGYPGDLPNCRCFQTPVIEFEDN